MNGKLHIDWIACDGRGLCSELLPGLLDRDEWGYPLVRAAGNGDGGTVAIGAQDKAAALDAVRLCPKKALHLGVSTPPATA